MNWSSDPPRISGLWFVGALEEPLKLHTSIVEVRRIRRQWQWSFINGLTWNPVKEYPTYKWAGPVEPPSLENFNRAK